MATSRSSIMRLLRATVSHRIIPATLIRPHNNLHHHHHIFTPTSPLSFLHSHPFNHRITNHHFFSTFAFQPVTPRPTTSRLHRVCGKLMYGMCLVILQICIVGVYTKMLINFLKRSQVMLDDEMGTKFKGSLTNFIRKGHTVVIHGFIKPVKLTDVDWGFEYYCLATEVLSQPEQILAAMERNGNIIAEKLNVANSKQNVAEELNVSGKEREVVVNWCTTGSGKISNPSKSKSSLNGLVLEGKVNQSAAFSVIAKAQIVKQLKNAVKDFKGLSDALQEGHSVVIERSIKPIKHGVKEEEDEWGKIVTVKVWDSECHISAKVLANDKIFSQIL